MFIVSGRVFIILHKHYFYLVLVLVQDKYSAPFLDKNSSGDEIANVNFLRRYGTYVLQNTKKENLLRLTN